MLAKKVLLKTRGCTVPSTSRSNYRLTAESCWLVQQLEGDTELLNIISNKLSEAIMSNETFKQLIHNAS